jgi:hypothetical protein
LVGGGGVGKKALGEAVGVELRSRVLSLSFLSSPGLAVVRKNSGCGLATSSGLARS